MQKFGRNYLLTVTGDKFTNPLAIALPFTIEFDITRNTLTSANVCQVRIYNLNATNRNLLRKNTTNYGTPITYIILQAGYETDSGNLPVIFSGNVSSGWSVRQGTNFITQLECYDGGYTFVNGQVNITVPKGTPYQIVIANIISSLPNLKIGAIGSYPGSTPRQVTYSGDAITILNQLTGGGFYIDKGIGNALGNSEYTVGVGPPAVISAETGLLDTPLLENNLVRFNMEFEPSLNVGTGIVLNSTTLDSIVSSNFNGLYKVTSVKHRGMISQTVCGDAVTTGEFFFVQTPTAVMNASQ